MSGLSMLGTSQWLCKTGARLQAFLDVVEGRHVALVMRVVMPVGGFRAHDVRQQFLGLVVGIRPRLQFPLMRHIRYLPSQKFSVCCWWLRACTGCRGDGLVVLAHAQARAGL